MISTPVVEGKREKVENPEGKFTCFESRCVNRVTNNHKSHIRTTNPLNGGVKFSTVVYLDIKARR